jgi:hypothetical protein
MDFWHWEIALHASAGKIVPQLLEHPRGPQDSVRLEVAADLPCEQALLPAVEEFFIPEHASKSSSAQA